MDQRVEAQNVPVVGIGSSAGGLEALREMFSNAEVPTGLAFVVVQHLDPHHESMLAELIGRHTALSVKQCQGGERIQPDTVFIIPPGHGLSISNGTLELTDFAQPRGLRRPIDDFFISLANDQNGNAACVILSGTGADGSTGLRAVKENGGLCVAQEPMTAKYDGMPLAAAGTGLVDFIQPPEKILACISGFFFRRTKVLADEHPSLVAEHIDELCRTLRNSVGHDFSGYKKTTFIRRIERRMHVLGIERAKDYLHRLQKDQEECEALFRDLLINVTRFFRDREFFDVLREKAILPLLDSQKGRDGGIRVWVPGCSSGEEAYSIAMLFAEAAREKQVMCDVQIFATDIDESMLQIARSGSYPNAALADIPFSLQEHYIIPHKDRFNFVGQIRDMIRFSGHSLVKDPPFSKIDLVSCRNLLIYFDDRLQKTIMPLFHYALRPGGYLFLGPSESVGRFENVFSSIDQKARLFERQPGLPTYPIPLPGGRQDPGRKPSGSDAPNGTARNDDERVVSRLLERYVPASMLLDHEGQIMAAFGKLSPFFDFPVSRSNETSAASLARPGVKEQIGPLLRQARTAKKRVISSKIEVVTEFGSLTTDIICDPLDDDRFLLVFQDGRQFTPLEESDLIELEPSNGHVEALERELRSAKHRLRSATEELETANEELKSSNEEMMSMNEELQSTNEELTTVNDELKNKIEQLTIANTDLRNFFDSTSLAVIVLDRDLRVRSFTRAATEIFPLQPSDRGRPISDVTMRLLTVDYINRVRSVMDDGVEYQDTVWQEETRKTFTLRILPYRTSDGSITGATIVLADISHAVSVESQLQREQNRHELAIEAAGIGVWEYLPEKQQFILGGSTKELLQATTDHLSTHEFLAKIRQEDRTQVLEAIRQTEQDQGGFDMTTELCSEHGPRWIKVFGRYVGDVDAPRIIGVTVDVTAEYRLAETRELMLNEMNHRVKNLFAMIGGILRMAGRKHETVQDLVSDVEGRILALGNAHSLASNQKRTVPVEIAELVKTILAPYDRKGGIEISQEPLPIPAKCITPLTLILHEWSTNALKYGALGQSDGKLKVSWKQDNENIYLLWNESVGKPVGAFGEKGFGTLLLSSAARQLGGVIDTKLEGSNLVHILTLPSSVLNDTQIGTHR
ncbi:CheR family methyltransferase [uncultured Agrobacterium sp.]|uniref:CheR family methyltransferase n=1 Tax=uncultured Agrobacterium sp. TaxID=157277 RepID=UPI0025DB671C|nr:CheR family methyltransferase [uncultured Agrobacterium sp.]